MDGEQLYNTKTNKNKNSVQSEVLKIWTVPKHTQHLLF